MGAVHIPLNLSKKPFAKSTNDLTDDDHYETNPEPPNGILKNAANKTLLLAQKSITFGEM